VPAPLPLTVNGNPNGLADVGIENGHPSAPVHGTYSVGNSVGWGDQRSPQENARGHPSVLGLTYRFDINFKLPRTSPPDGRVGWGYCSGSIPSFPAQAVACLIPPESGLRPTGNLALSLQTSTTNKKRDASVLFTIAGPPLEGKQWTSMGRVGAGIAF